MKGTPIKKILILVTILAVPGFLYYLLQEKGKNRYRPLPIFGPKEVASTFHSVRGTQIPDTIYHVVNDFTLVNQNRDSVSLSKYDNNILILNLFYIKGDANGGGATTRAVKGFSETYQHNKAINFLSISIDTKDDTQEKLADYAKTLSAKAGKWDLLTGDSTQLLTLVQKGLFLDAHQEHISAESKFVYSNMLVLLDSHHRIRGYYEATSQEALSKLDDEIKVLLAEELRNSRDGR
nr:SCO family protein [Pedobacter panaciterrae]